MGPISTTTDRTRQERVLTAALEVFGRYGFRKTSMDEVARAADISRQGLYLYFASKEALFRAAVRQELDTALGDASRCLDEEGTPLDQRVVGALDAWLGRYVGSMLASDISGLLRNPAVQIEDMVDATIATFDAKMAAAVAAATTETDRRRLGVTPEEIAAALHTVGQGARYLSTARGESRVDFLARLTPAVRLVLAGFGATTKTDRDQSPDIDGSLSASAGSDDAVPQS